MKSIIFSERICKFTVTTNITVNNGFQQSFSIPYIRAAGGLFIHWIQCLSLLTARGCRLFFAPTSSFNFNFFTSKSNDK